ncbi:MAG: hypothetical protein HRU29_16435 [Rhizobiales bacterium]|nr:hypothetical protein [Hyphomicrobiales bacterium]
MILVLSLDVKGIVLGESGDLLAMMVVALLELLESILIFFYITFFG